MRTKVAFSGTYPRRYVIQNPKHSFFGTIPAFLPHRNVIFPETSKESLSQVTSSPNQRRRFQHPSAHRAYHAMSDHALAAAVEEGAIKTISNGDGAVADTTTKRVFVGNWFSCLLLGWQAVIVVIFLTATKLDSEYMPAQAGESTMVSTGAHYPMFQVSSADQRKRRFASCEQ
jgi:hypothetical protein